MKTTKRGGARPGSGQPRKPADTAVSVRFSLALTPAEADEYRRRGAGPWVRRMLQTERATDAVGTMHYYATRSLDDPLYGRLAYVCWMAYRPIEDIQDIASYRDKHVRAAFSFEDDAIAFCQSNNELLARVSRV